MPVGATLPPPSYVEPAGATLSEDQTKLIAELAAKNAGDAEPSEEVSVEATLHSVMQAVDPQYTLLSEPITSVSDWLNSRAILISMRGDFKLLNAQVPPGADIPTGSVLDLVVDAHTGATEMVYVGQDHLVDLTQLGKVVTLK